MSRSPHARTSESLARFPMSGLDQSTPLIDDVLSETGQPLEPELGATMERGFGEDFSNVRVHASRAAGAANRMLGSLAFTVGSRIVLGFPASVLSSSGGRLVLAHELAHVVQKRRGKSGVMSSARQIEAEEREAASAAARISAGETARCRIASDPARVSAWGEVGHFYTVYFVMLAVGFPAKKAQHIAFFTQFPDEVEELDAYTIGVRYMKGKVLNSIGKSISVGGMGGMGGPRMIQPAEQKMWDEADAQLRDSLHIQRGLHALTGANAESETDKRTNILDAMSPGDADFDFDFGLALHPYGDSFAHRDGGNMFKPPVGHGLHGNAPDVISFDRQDLYLRYVNEMYELASTKTARGGVRLSQQDTASTLKRLCAAGSALNCPQPLQAGWIREWSRGRMHAPMSDYNPLDYDVVPFTEFIEKSYSRLAGVQKRHFDRAIALSRKWA